MTYLILFFSILNLLLGIVIFIQPRRGDNQRTFLLFATTASVWTFNNFLLRIFQTVFFLRLSYSLGAFVALFALVWIVSFLRKKLSIRIWILLFSVATVIAIIATGTHEIIQSFTAISYFGYFAKVGGLFPFYTTYAGAVILLIIYLLAREYFSAQIIVEKRQIAVVMTGATIFALTSLVVSFVFPVLFNSLEYVVLDNISFSIFFIFIVYAILKLRLFDVKVVATELLTFGLWAFILVRTIFSSGLDQLVNGGLLLITVLFGAFLIRSVIREVEARETIEGLAKKLEGANSELEGANEKLKKLDQQKSEFVSIASHQLRSPLTVIKGYLSMFLEGEEVLGNIKGGTITPKGAEVMDTMFQSTVRLAHIIEDFLNVSRIEQGRMKYEMSDFDIRQMTTEVVAEFKGTVAEKKITLAFSDKTPGESYMVSADSGKLRQVIGNVIDNSIKYTPQGGITVYLERTKDSIRINVKDTGIGISAENLKNLFQKFARATNAGKVNVTGSGLGLFVAIEIMKAHNGKLWAESDGEGKGSTFIIELPLKQ